MSNFPTSKDDATSLPNPGGTDKQNSPDHAALHTAENGAIIAVETKLGTGASTPVANTFLFGTGVGASAWTQATSAQIAAAVSDETGTGSLVFANTPALITPKVDTINENTLSNGVTVAGVNMKSGALTTANSVPTGALQANSITTAKLATGTSFQPNTVASNPYKFSVYRNAALTPGVDVNILFDTVDFDTSSNYSAATGKFTAPINGFYQFGALVGVLGTPASFYMAALIKNTTVWKYGNTANSASQANPQQGVSDVIQLVAGDTISVQMHAGSSLPLAVARTQTYFSGYLVSAT